MLNRARQFTTDLQLFNTRTHPINEDTALGDDGGAVGDVAGEITQSDTDTYEAIRRTELLVIAEDEERWAEGGRRKATAATAACGLALYGALIVFRMHGKYGKNTHLSQPWFMVVDLSYVSILIFSLVILKVRLRTWKPLVGASTCCYCVLRVAVTTAALLTVRPGTL